MIFRTELVDKSCPVTDNRATTKSGKLLSVTETDLIYDYMDSKVILDCHILQCLLLNKELQGQWFGTKLIQLYADSYPNALIIGEVGLLEEEHGNIDDLSQEEYQVRIKCLMSFYYKLGFVGLGHFY